MQLQKITTEYSEAEDRFRLTGKNSEGGQVSIWLTQRLLQRLIPVLLKRLSTDSRVTTSSRPDEVQGFAQQSARASMRAETPLVVDLQTHIWLAERVDISSSASRIVLTFFSADGKQAQIPMADQVLRQWLGIVYDKYRAAQWPLNLWPQWFSQGQLQATSSQSVH